MSIRPAVAACCLLAGPVAAAPFPTRDQNPLLAGLGLSLPLPAELATGATRIEGTVNWSNTANSRPDGNEAILVDIESRELRLTLEHGIGKRVAIRLELPYRRLNAGVLDGFIDGWHDAFGMPEGARVFLPRDDFRLAWFRDGKTLIDLREPVGGMGDLVLQAGFQLLRGEDSSVALWLSAEGPTGDEEQLLGNGAWDFALNVSGAHAFSSRGTLHWQAGGSYLGSGGPLKAYQKDWAGSVMGSFEYGVWRGLFLKGQIDAHTAAYRSKVQFLGPAVILTLGADYRFASGWLFDVGISEDIEVSASPDVSFTFALRRIF